MSTPRPGPQPGLFFGINMLRPLLPTVQDAPLSRESCRFESGRGRHVVHSSSGLGCRTFNPDDVGSNPTCTTNWGCPRGRGPVLQAVPRGCDSLQLHHASYAEQVRYLASTQMYGVRVPDDAPFASHGGHQCVGDPDGRVLDFYSSCCGFESCSALCLGRGHQVLALLQKGVAKGRQEMSSFLGGGARVGRRSRFPRSQLVARALRLERGLSPLKTLLTVRATLKK